MSPWKLLLLLTGPKLHVSGYISGWATAETPDVLPVSDLHGQTKEFHTDAREYGLRNTSYREAQRSNEAAEGRT